MAKIADIKYQNLILPSRSISGLKTQTIGSNIVRVNPGNATAEDLINSISLQASIEKDVSLAWAQGNGGGLDTGSVANTSYHIYIIKNLNTGNVDSILSVNANIPALPAGYTLFRRVASCVRAGGVIFSYHQFGDDFYWNIPAATVAISGVPANAAHTIQVPTGIEVLAKGIIHAGRSGSSNGDKALSITSPNFGNFNAVSAPDIASFRGHTGGQYAASSFGADMKGGSSYFESMTNTNGQIEVDVTGTSGINGGLCIVGFKDFRGQDEI